jgi:hypothetical protein
MADADADQGPPMIDPAFEAQLAAGKAAGHPASIQQNEPEQGETPSSIVETDCGVTSDEGGRS